LFIELAEAFDTVLRKAIFVVLRRFGLPGHFSKAIMRPHFGAKVKAGTGEEDLELGSIIGDR
jgi:hypothetical protein